MQSRLYCAEVGVLLFPNQRTGGVSVVGCAYCYSNNSARVCVCVCVCVCVVGVVVVVVHGGGGEF